MTQHGIHNSRGVALLIALLVTALLIALIFEFSYGTRVSLRAAVNFRDSQRAYFLARSGVYAFAKYNDLKNLIPQGEWGVVPIISGGDTEVRIKWEDELGKIRISRIRKNESLNPSLKWMRQLFTNLTLDQDILDKIADSQMTFYLPTELHQVMNDEEFSKIERFVTTMPSSLSSVYQININTASREVLEAMGITQADTIVNALGRQQCTQVSEVKKYMDEQTFSNLFSNLTCTSTIYKVYSYATVGGYTQQVEAIIQGSNPSYWRAL